MPTALLIIDIQHALCHGPDAVENSAAVIDRVNQSADQARAAGAPVIFVQHEDEDALQRGSEGWQLMAGLHQQPEDLHLPKRGSDAFHHTELQAMLKMRHISALVICGMQTEYCVESTVRRALALGYPVTLAADAHTTAPNGVLTVAQVIAHHHATLAGLGSYGVRASIRPVADIRF